MTNKSQAGGGGGGSWIFHKRERFNLRLLNIFRRAERVKKYFMTMSYKKMYTYRKKHEILFVLPIEKAGGLLGSATVCANIYLVNTVIKLKILLTMLRLKLLLNKNN